MAKTLFVDRDLGAGIQGTVVTAAFLNAIFRTGGGHIHDGGEDDGHVQRITSIGEIRADDPDTSGWGEDEAPYFWFNTAEKKLKIWNGEATVDFTVIDIWVDASLYASLSEADVAAYNAGKLLVISQNYTLTENTTLNASVMRVPGGSFTKDSSYTLHFAGKFIHHDDGRAFIGFDPGDVTYGEGSVEYARPEWFTENETMGVTDMTNAFSAALASCGRLRMLDNSAYLLSDTVIGDGAGSYSVEGVRSVFNADLVPASPKGSLVIWDGDADVPMFEFGGRPLYIAGVFQEDNDWQNNVSIKNFTVHIKAPLLHAFYIHDGDNLDCKSMFVNGFGEAGLRGVFDCRGTVSNARFKHVTVYDVPHGYGWRMGDAFVNAEFNQCCTQKTALGYWIGDTLTYEKPYPDGMTVFRTSSCEGTVTGGSPTIKFVVDTVNDTHLAGVTELTVADGTKFAAEDNVWIGRGTGGSDLFEMNYITEVNGNVLTLAYPTEYAHDVGEPIKGGTSLGFHIGGSNVGQSTGVTLDHCMINWVGCGIDVHYSCNLNLLNPRVPGKVKTFLYLDDDVNNVVLHNPDIWDGKDADYKFLQCRTGATGIYDIFWYGKPDRSGVAYPYDFEPDTDGDYYYIGSQLQTGRLPVELPKYFRAITFDNTYGLRLRETENAVGLFYHVGEESVKKLMFGCEADGTPWWNEKEGLPPRMYNAAGESFGPNTKFIFGYSTLVAGTVTVTLTGEAIFNHVDTYAVMVTRSASTNGWTVARNSASEFVITSSNGADTDLVQWLAFGV